MKKTDGILVGGLIALVFGLSTVLVACGSSNSDSFSSDGGGSDGTGTGGSGDGTGTGGSGDGTGTGGSGDGTGTGGSGDGTGTGGSGDGTTTGGSGDGSSAGSSRLARSPSADLQGTWRTGCLQDSDDLSSFGFTQVVFSGNSYQLTSIGFGGDSSCSSGADSVDFEQGNFALGRSALTSDGVDARAITFTSEDDVVRRDIVSRNGDSLYFGADNETSQAPTALDFNRPLNRE